jgi:RNA polymerase sigma factor (sigma-70 family)
MSAESPFLPETEVRTLIGLAQGGDREAFARVIEQVRPFVCKLARQYARRVGGVPIEDLVQVGLLAAVRSVPCFDPAAGVKFVSYAGVSAQRAIHRAVIAWKLLPQAGKSEADFLGEMADHRELPVIGDKETANFVRKLIEEQLGERERELVGQRFGLDGSPPRTYSELAEVTGTSRQNVQQLVERALRRLRNHLADAVNA